jgi:uncharacterized protein
MATPTYPGVYIQELPSAVHPITGVATSIAAFVGYTARGIDNRAQEIFSMSDYERLYGGLESDSEVSYAVSQFFTNGGSQAWVVRAPRNGAQDAAVVITGLAGGATEQLLAFEALSSGAWANGQLLIDVDYNGLYTPVAGSVNISSAATSPYTVTGTATFFTTALEVGDYLIFAADTTQTPYEIKAIASDTSLTLETAYSGTIPAGGITTASVVDDPMAFNLTITDVVDDIVESFPDVTLNSNYANYAQTVINDPDNGSQLVTITNVYSSPTTAPPVSGVLGGAVDIYSISSALGGTTLGGTVAVTINSETVTGTNFTSSLVGQWLVFASDPKNTPYKVSAVANPTSLTLSANFGAATGVTSAILLSISELSGTVTVTQYSPAVTGAGTSFSSGMIGQWVIFASDSSNTPYQISSVSSATSLALSSPYLGTTTAGTTVSLASATTGQGWGLSLSVSSPATAPPPLPITVTLFAAANASIPQTMSGLASQLQQAINAALSVQMSGASVQCSVFGVGVWQQIRINASLPQMPDAVLFFPPLSSATLGDASSVLGLSPDALTLNVAHYALGTGNGSNVNHWQGNQYSSSAGYDGTGLPSTTQLIGDPGSYTGIYALQKIDAFNILCIPEATRASAVNASTLDPTVNPNAIYTAAIALCHTMRAFLIVDCPPYVNTIASAVDWKTTGLTVNDPSGAAYFPRLRLPDPLNNYNLRTFAPCGVVAGVYANTDSTRGVWKSPAGTAATLAGVQSMIYKMTDAENGVLNPLGLNCFRTFPIYGAVCWGARTLVGADAEASQWKYLSVRRTALFLESSLYQGTQWVVFEPNDEPLWSAIRINVGSFMQNLFVQGYFQGSTPQQAYFVKCDSETTTQTDIDNGIVNIVVGFAPLMPAEFVIIQIEQLAGQTAS